MNWSKYKYWILFILVVSGIFVACTTSKEAKVNAIIKGAEFSSSQKYFNNRKELMKAEADIRFDADAKLLDTTELIANRFFLQLKKREIARMKDRKKYPPSSYFLEIKSFIDQSPFYLTVQTIPKGAMLQGHIQTIGDYKGLLNNASYLDDCYIYIGSDNDSWTRNALRFANKPPSRKWRSLQAMKGIVGEGFMDEMYHNITLGRDDYPYEKIPEEYEKSLQRVDGIVSYKPLFQDYVYNSLKSLVRDNVTYVELHSSFNGMYNLDRSYFNPFTELDLYVAARNKIQREHPDFDFKVIYSVGQSQKRKTLLEHYEVALGLKKKYPDVLGGFDFASIDYTKEEFEIFLEKYLEVQEAHNVESELALFYSPSESEKQLNNGIYDAVLLDCKRIGYAYHLLKYPLLMEMVKEQNIAVEVSPISNQVLGYTADLRDHPAKIYLNHGIPVVLGSENQGIMDFTYSHQFYEAIMAWDLDLAGVKQLILNSIRYSNQPKWKKQQMEDLWRSRWKKFIQQLIDRSKIEVIEY